MSKPSQPTLFVLGSCFAIHLIITSCVWINLFRPFDIDSKKHL